MGLSDEQKKELNRKKRDENAAHAYEQILGELGFANVGASVSRKEREETHQLGTPHLRYAEAGFDPVKVVLDKIQDTYGKPNVGHSGPGGRLQRDGEAVFYDLGSGMGNGSHRFLKTRELVHVRGVRVALLLEPDRVAVALPELHALHAVGVPLGEGGGGRQLQEVRLDQRVDLGRVKLLVVVRRASVGVVASDA